MFLTRILATKLLKVLRGGGGLLVTRVHGDTEVMTKRTSSSSCKVKNGCLYRYQNDIENDTVFKRTRQSAPGYGFVYETVSFNPYSFNEL